MCISEKGECEGGLYAPAHLSATILLSQITLVLIFFSNATKKGGYRRQEKKSLTWDFSLSFQAVPTSKNFLKYKLLHCHFCWQAYSNQSNITFKLLSCFSLVQFLAIQVGLQRSKAHWCIWELHIAKVRYFFPPSFPGVEGLILGPLLFFFYQKTFIFHFNKIHFQGLICIMQWEKSICHYCLTTNPRCD